MRQNTSRNPHQTPGQNPLLEISPLSDSLADLLRCGANTAFRHHRNETLIAHLVRRIEGAIAESTNPVWVRDVVRTLITELDYRLVAEYLRALRTSDTAAINGFEGIVAADTIPERNRKLYEVKRAQLFRTTPPTHDGNILFVPRLEDIFARSERGLTIYLSDRALQSPLVNLLADTGSRFGYFVEQQYDLPGINALVRQGVVKTWVAPDGTAVVSKRDNPHKPGRFRVEQLNYQAVMSRISDRQHLGRTAEGGGVWFTLARPFAIIRDGFLDRYYALSVWIDGISLEELLLNQGDPAIRRTHLTHYRWLLDALYNRGILWGDMSPRNILVQSVGPDRIYHILDFEKTRVLDQPATTAERIVHCRGQIGVEELGVLCPPAEVEECFRGYFAPGMWELDSEAALPFPPRPEVAAILHGRGLHDLTLGTYNRTDREIMSVRIPDIDPITGGHRFPGHLGFKIEHYLSCADYTDAIDYDRKTTEILIAAKRHGCFDAIVELLKQATDRVENAVMIVEFEALLDESLMYRLSSPRPAIDALAQTIDTLYHSRTRAEDFQSCCYHLGSGEQRT